MGMMRLGTYSPERLRQDEFTEIITADGETYRFNNLGGRWMLEMAGGGMSPVQYLTERGPFQDGVRITDFFLRPRLVDLVLRDARCSRQQYWDARSEVIDHLRPNRSADGTVQPARLVKITPDGTGRRLDVFWQEGLRFEPQGQAAWDRWAFHDPLRLFAPDATWYDPTQVSVTATLAALVNLVFPITFDVGAVPPGIQFGSSTIDTTETVNYPGTWPTGGTYRFLTLVFVGPINSPRVDNLTIGEHILLNYNVPAGRTVTVSLGYGQKTVVDDLGTNLIGTVDEGSDLATFRLEPHPRATNGNNSLRFRGAGAVAGQTSMALAYFTRYVGI